MAEEQISHAKHCTKCGKKKLLSQFHVRKASPDGLAYRCRDCVNAYTAEWKKKNLGAFRRWYAKNRQRRAEYWREWYERNRDHRAKSYAEWARENKHIVNALIAKRNAAKKQATPPWADMDLIRAFYEAASLLTEETGIRHEVDHIYPLQGEFVCGLHCEANLQILTKTDNIRKHNRMPEELGYA